MNWCWSNSALEMGVKSYRFYASSSAELSQHQFVVVTSGVFTFTSVYIRYGMHHDFKGKQKLIIFCMTFLFFRISDILFKRVRSPWYWPRFLFNMIGPGKQHDHCLKLMHDFAEKVSLISNDTCI